MVRYPSLLANLFSSTFIKQVINNEHQLYFHGILRQTNFEKELKKSIPLGSALHEVFNFLNENYRCEYVFKTAILNELLLKRHDLIESAYLTEFRAFNAKADIIILNGTSTVYEIKSDIDNFARLLNQVSIYQKMFDRVYVVSNSKNLLTVKKIIPKGVGIAVLNDDLTIDFKRESASHIKQLDQSYMFDSLRKPEYLSMIKAAFGEVPKVAGTLIHARCKKLFCTLDPKKAHSYFLQVLKSRKFNDTQIELIHNVNLGLKGLVSDKYYSEKECKRISFALNQKITQNVSPLHPSKAV